MTFNHLTRLQVQETSTYAQKVKVHPITDQRPRETAQVQLYTFSNLGAKCGWVVNATCLPLYPRERDPVAIALEYVGPRASLDGHGKSRPPLRFDPRTIQPVASRYPDWAIPVHFTDACMFLHSQEGESIDKCLKGTVLPVGIFTTPTHPHTHTHTHTHTYKTCARVDANLPHSFTN
jgi:hypothetical protein